jgi:signal peptidase
MTEKTDDSDGEKQKTLFPGQTWRMPGMNNIKKIGNIILDVLVVAVLVISVMITIASVSSQSSGVANLFGCTLLSVQTDSMEPVIKTGDLIVGRLNADSNQEYEVGDIVTFQMLVDRSLIYNTHRIIAKEIQNGVAYYTTQGDNAAAADQGQIVSGDIISAYRGIRIPKLGIVMDYLQTQMGFFLCVLLPMIVLFCFQLGGFVRNLVAYNKEKAAEEAVKAVTEAAAVLTEEQKQQVIREYLENRSPQQAGGK